MLKSKILLTVLSIIALLGCVVDCSSTILDTKLVFNNQTDSTVAVFGTQSDLAMLVLLPHTSRNIWSYGEPTTYKLRIGKLIVVDSMGANTDTTYLFKNSKKHIYMQGKGKCRRMVTEIEYFITKAYIQ